MSTLNVILGLDARKFKSGTAEAASYAKNFGGTLRTALIEALGPIALAMEAINFIKGSFDEAAKIADLSDKFQVDAEQLQRIAFAAKDVGIEMEATAGIIKNLNKAFAQALGDKNKFEALRKLGFTAEEIAAGGIDAQSAILRMSEALDKSANPAQTLAVLMDALGKSGADAAALLQNPTDELQRMMRDAPVMSNKMVDLADKMDRSFQTVGATMKIVGMGIVAVLGIVIAWVGMAVGGIVTIVSAFVGKVIDLLGWMAEKAEKLAKALKMTGTAESLAGVKKALEGASASVDKFTIASGEFVMGSKKIQDAGFDVLFGGDDTPAKKKKKRDIAELEQKAGTAGKTAAQGGISSMAVIGGGGLVAQFFDPTLKTAKDQLAVAEKQLEEQKKTNAQLANQPSTITE